MADIIGATGSTVTSAVAASTGTSGSSTTSTASKKTTGIADNFQTFLTLLTTQLQNQNPLDPLDTNQFTQQLVQFAQVEQQLKSNDELSTLVSLQQSAQATQALGFVGHNVTIDSSSAKMTNSAANWGFNTTQDGTVNLTITNATGQTAYSGSFSSESGQQQFKWDGKGNDGSQWPDGTYKMTVTMNNGSGTPVAVPTQVQGAVDSVDLTKSPPLLSVNGQTFTINQIKSISS